MIMIVSVIICMVDEYFAPEQVIIEPSTMFWRQIGGHLKKVETCSVGVTWGIGYDSTAWVYTGGWGGTFLKGILLFFYDESIFCKRKEEKTIMKLFQD